MSDQDRIAPYSINMISSRQVHVIGKQKKGPLGDYWLFQNQILLTSIVGIV